ncbi:MAG: hypothetical protein JJ896_01460 [Rhodothermales bacterium]|nr:hypothetical protein [Rhodothermales bacterium]MBO6778296.1 hypothetical protein [Rhodothermales bacterium]
MSRPLSVTASAWFLLINGVLSVPALIWALSMPEARELVGEIGRGPATLVISSLGPLLSVAAGWGMLEGHKWGRNLFLGVLLFSLFWGSFQFSSSMEGAWVWQLIVNLPSVAIAIAITRPRATAWFDGEPDPEPGLVPGLHRYRRARQSGDLARIVGLIVLVSGTVLAYFSATLVASLYAVLFSSSGSGGFSGYATFFMVPLLLGVVALVLGIFLWGRKRWQATLGLVLASVGAFQALLAAQLPFFLNGPFMDMMRREDSAFSDPEFLAELGPMVETLQSLGWYGLMVALVGGMMAWHRWAEDRHDVRADLATGTG